MALARAVLRLATVLLVQRPLERLCFRPLAGRMISPSAEVAVFWLYVQLIYSVIIFRPQWVRRISGVRKFLKLAGAADFVERDQRLPCCLSHPGESCCAVSWRLSTSWWTRLAPYVVLFRTALLMATAMLGSRKVPAFWGGLRSTVRYTLFLFGASGVPGFVFCLTKKLSGEGHPIGVTVSAAVASGSLLLLPPPDRRGIVTKIGSTSTAAAVVVLASQVVAWIRVRVRLG